MNVDSASTSPMFFTVLLTWMGWPCPALDVGLLSEVTTRSGDSRMVISSNAVVQLLELLTSDTISSASAQACTLYVSGIVSENTLNATAAPSPAPGASSGIAWTPFRFFFVEPLTR